MKYTIVSWNCNGGFRNKFPELLKAYPEADIFVIHECEDPYFYDVEEFKRLFGNGFRIGTKQKGIAVFAREGITLKRLDWPGDANGYSFAPTLVDEAVTLLACWTHGSYIEELHDYLDANLEKFGQPTLMIGDLNSSVVFDKNPRQRSHASLIERLEGVGHKPLYHHFSGDEQGRESVPTYYHLRKTDRPFHIDHAFADPNYIVAMEIAPLDTHASWLKLSDHMPLKVVLDTDPQAVVSEAEAAAKRRILPPDSYYDENGMLHKVTRGVTIKEANEAWGNRQKQRRSTLRINLPGGRSISHPDYGESLKLLILELDWERIHRMGFEVHGAPLISQTKHKLSREIVPGWYLNCNMTRVQMSRLIKEIGAAVDILITTTKEY